MDYNAFDIIITNNALKESILSKLSNKVVNIKIMTLQELKDKYIFKYDEKALVYLMEKYNYNYDIAKVYLNNLLRLYNQNIDNIKVNKIKKIYQELNDNKLIIYNPLFKKYLHNKQILIIDNFLTKEEKNFINILKKDELNITIKEIKLNNYSHNYIFKASTITEECLYVASKISELLLNNTDINKIKIYLPNNEYYKYIKRIFKFYNIPITITTSTIYATNISKTFFNNFSDDLEANINKLKEKFPSKSQIEIIEKIITIINKYIYVKDKEILKKILINEFKNTKLDTSIKNNEVKIINNIQLINDDEYLFLLGFNQGLIPKTIKNEDYLSDTIKEELDIDTSSNINTLNYNKWLSLIKNIKNITITYKLKSETGDFYLSSLNDDLNLEIKNIIIPNNYSNLYNMINLTSKIDTLIKYNEQDNELPILYKHYKNILKYQTYNNKFTTINNQNLLKYLNNKITLSYSNMNTYYQCSFRYYLANILKINIYENTFKTTIGNAFHHVLSKVFTSNIDVEEEYFNYLNNSDYKLNEEEDFFAQKLFKELLYDIDIIKKQQESSKLSKMILEEKIEDIKEKNNITYTFKGFVDKIITTDTYETVAIIDYKTGSLHLDLNNTIHGLSLQLPVYIYLAKKKFANARIAGFYLQKIIHNEIKKDFKHHYDDLKKDNLKLQGYSNSDTTLIEQIDNNYVNSSIIKGMKTNLSGSLSTKKILDDVKIDKLTDIVQNKIDEAFNNIEQANFEINPKKIGKTNLGCEFCNFKDICYLKDENIRNLKEYKELEFLKENENE